MPSNPPIVYDFPLDPFQQHAMKAICAGENVLVTAKTGSGKTLVGEIQIAESLRKGKRVFYTTPIKSLSNQKFHDLKKQFGSVGIMTGDIKFAPQSSVVIMTTEILRNLLFKKDSTTKSLGLTAEISCEDLDAVIFDECHYINDRDRGHVWEEVMILLPPEVKLVMLSATLDHPELFAGWLGQLKKRPIHLISTEYRIVPLLHTLYYNNKFHTLMDAKNVYTEKVYKDWLEWREGVARGVDQYRQKVRDAQAGGHEGRVEGKVRQMSFVHQMNELIEKLNREGGLPALFFVLSRNGCEKYAEKVSDTLLTSSEVADVKHIWSFHLRNHKEKLEKLPQYHTLQALVERGIAFHHSGLVPTLKEIIELLFAKGFIKVLFATETFAVGINMPTKTAVFVGLKKYDDEVQNMRVLKTAEYLQMAGRAGRRGLDTQGLVIYLPDRDPVEAYEMKAMMTGGKAPVTSRMEFDYDFILKTLQSGNRTWLEILENSYWRQQRHVLITSLKTDQIAHLNRLKQIQISEDDRAAMEQKEELEALYTGSVNKARKKAELDLRRWKEDHTSVRWELLASKWVEIKAIEKKLALLSLDLKAALDVSCDVETRIRVLEELGYLKPVEDPKAHSKDSLTLKGVLATELNEADAMTMVNFFLDPSSKDLSPQETLAVLAACITDGKSDSMPTIEELGVPKGVKDALYKIQQVWDTHADAESKLLPTNLLSPLKLSTYWIDPLWRWMEGDSIAAICADYDGLYEGNLIRAVLKLQNMLDEWRSMATYCQETETLKKFEDANSLLLRDSVIQDSLYLHL